MGKLGHIMVFKFSTAQYNSQTEEMSDNEIDQPDIFLLSVSYKPNE